MSYHVSDRASESSAALGNAIAGLFVAGVTFVLGYTVVRATLAQNAPVAVESGTDIEVVIPHEATLWEGFGTDY